MVGKVPFIYRIVIFLSQQAPNSNGDRADRESKEEKTGEKGQEGEEGKEGGESQEGGEEGKEGEGIRGIFTQRASEKEEEVIFSPKSNHRRTSLSKPRKTSFANYHHRHQLYSPTNRTHKSKRI